VYKNHVHLIMMYSNDMHEVYTRCCVCVCSYLYVSSRKCKRLQPLGNFMFQRWNTSCELIKHLPQTEPQMKTMKGTKVSRYVLQTFFLSVSFPDCA